jgi:hypothetical protein
LQSERGKDAVMCRLCATESPVMQVSDFSSSVRSLYPSIMSNNTLFLLLRVVAK